VIEPVKMALPDGRWGQKRLARRARWARSSWIRYYNVCRWDVNDLRKMGCYSSFWLLP